MFGYACTETEELMPLPIMLAHKLVQRLADVRKKGELDYLRPDGKSQVSVRYVDGKPVSVETVVISTQHGPDVPHDKIRADMIERVILPTIPAHLIRQGQDHLSRQSDGALRHRRSDGRHGLDRAQDHRGYVRRLLPARRGGVLRQGSDEGGPLGVLHGAARGQEHRRGRARGAGAGAGGLRHRRRRARVDHGGDVRHRQGVRTRRWNSSSAGTSTSRPRASSST